MTVGQIFTKSGNFIENRQIFMLLNCNCAKLANFEDFKTCLGGLYFVDTMYYVCILDALHLDYSQKYWELLALVLCLCYS